MNINMLSQMELYREVLETVTGLDVKLDGRDAKAYDGEMLRFVLHHIVTMPDGRFNLQLQRVRKFMPRTGTIVYADTKKFCVKKLTPDVLSAAMENWRAEGRP